MNNIFISFSGPAREEYAIKFLNLFNKYGLNCWYDQHELLLGDELKLTIINEGINTANYCVLIINQSFLNRKWPCEEARLLYERFKNKKDCVIFPVLLDISKQDLKQSKVSFLLDIKYQFLKSGESIENIGLQIINRILNDVLKNYKFSSVKDCLKYFEHLTYSESIDIYNVLEMITNFDETSYKERSILYLCLVRLLNNNPYEKAIREIAYHIYNGDVITFDMYKIAESIFLICASSFVI